MSGDDSAAVYFDLPTLRRVEALVAGLDPAGEPEAVVLVEAASPAPQFWGEVGTDHSPLPAGGDPPLKREGEGGIATPERLPDTATSRMPRSPQDWGAGRAASVSRSTALPRSPSTGPLAHWPTGPLTHDFSLAIIAGSFDPPTNAHLALARAAREVGGCDAVYLALSRHTVDKETRTRPSDADRALLLGQIAAREPGLGVILFNRGLYADQAVAARAAFQGATISFVVGFDKARQIFDPRYYADRDAALRQLFERVGLLVAPRAADGPDALVALLERPENAPFRDHVRALPLDAAWAADSSTVVRAAARAGERYETLVPPETAAFIAALAPYAAPDPVGLPDRYERRAALIARLANAPDAPRDLRPLLR